MTAYLCRRWQATGSQWCTDDGVALAGWAPPGRPEVDVERPTIVHPESRVAKFEALRIAFGEHTPTEPHWYLNMLATHPDWQRQGLGAALMGEVFRIADEQGLPCYLETETRGQRRLLPAPRIRGAVGVDACHRPTVTGPHMWGMLRSPR